MVSIDALNLSDVRYVKLDVEGAETLVLSGMIRTLRGDRPLILYEDRDDRRLPQEVWNHFADGNSVTILPSPFLRAQDYRVERLASEFIAIPMPRSSTEPARQRDGLSAIPARVFQTWKSKEDIPDRFRMWRDSFRIMNPNFLLELWDDADNRVFIKEQFPWFLQKYDGYRAEIYRADAIRYFYLYMFGGIYADMDTECLRPLDPLLEMSDVILGRMGADLAFEHSIPNAIMAAKARQEFWLFLIALMAERAAHVACPEYVTGPILLKSALDLYLGAAREWVGGCIGKIRSFLRASQQPEPRASRIRVLDPHEWYPIDWSNLAHQPLRRQLLRGQVLDRDAKALLFPSAWMVTYWAHTWE